MRIINDYFINKKLKQLEFSKKILNIREDLDSVQTIFVIFNENIENTKYYLSIKQSLNEYYKDKEVYFLFFRFSEMYNDLNNIGNYSVSIPNPIKFKELDTFEVIRKRHKIDLLYDLSTIDFRYRLMIKRILNPKIAIAEYNEYLVNDFSILIKTGNNPTNLFKMMGIDLFDINTINKLKERLNTIETSKLQYVFIGNSFSVKRKMKKAIKEKRNYLYIENPEKSLNIFYIKSILNANELFYDKKYGNIIKFINQLNK